MLKHNGNTRILYIIVNLATRGASFRVVLETKFRPPPLVLCEDESSNSSIYIIFRFLMKISQSRLLKQAKVNFVVQSDCYVANSFRNYLTLLRYQQIFVQDIY